VRSPLRASILAAAALALAIPATALAAGQPPAPVVPARPAVTRLALPGGGRAVISTPPGGPRTALLVSRHPAALLTVDQGGRELAVADAGRPVVLRRGVTARTAASRTITVVGTGPGGSAPVGQVMVGDVANENEPANDFKEFKDGQATFTGPPGTYWALAVFYRFASGHRLTELWMDVLPQFTVRGNTTVQTKASAATSLVTLATPRRAVTKSVGLTVVRAAPHAPANGLSPLVSSFGQTVSGIPLWVSPVRHAPGYGTLHAFTTGQLISPRGAASRYAYTLNFADPAGTIPPQHLTATPASLATETENYYQDVPATSAWQDLGGTPYQIATSFFGADAIQIRTPAREVRYLSASPPTLWESVDVAHDIISAGETDGGQTDAFRLLHGGQRLTQNWNQYPLHPGVDVVFPGAQIATQPSAARAGNLLVLDLTPFSDNQPGHLGTGLVDPVPGQTADVHGRYALYQDGRQIAAGNAVTATGGYGGVFVGAELSPRPAVLRFVLTASRASRPYPLSATSRDVWTWPTRRDPGATVPAPWLCETTAAQTRHCAVQPLVTLDYDVAGLSLYGQTAPGRQTVTLTPGHLQLTAARRFRLVRVQVSFTGGRHWQPASVRALRGGRFAAGFSAPRGAGVSLRVTATDAAGSSLTETILRAYRVR
jgi:hypothetical protein